MNFNILYRFGKKRRLKKYNAIRNNSARASHPGGFPLCHQKTKLLRPDLYDIRCLYKNLVSIHIGVTWLELFTDHLTTGDTRAAVVVNSIPGDHFEVAAYTDELDCVAILRFKDYNYGYNVGDRMLTVNRYGYESDEDLIPGEMDTGSYRSFTPIIANLVCSDEGYILSKMSDIRNWEWNRVYDLGLEYKQKYPNVYRDGAPGYSEYPKFSISPTNSSDN